MSSKMLKAVEAKEFLSNKVQLESVVQIDLWHVLPETWTQLGN